MNFKTTIGLLIALVVVGGALLLGRPGAQSTEATDARDTSSSIQRFLVREDFGEVRRIVCRREGQPEWVFDRRDEESSSGTAQWDMTAPFAAKVQGWDVDRIARTLKSAKYEISYPTGAVGAPSAAQAGLDPPRAIITLTDENDRSVTVEIGRKASSSETYARLAGAEDIYVVRSDLSTLLKKRASEYRDRVIFSFDAVDAVRLAVVDHRDAEPVEYVLLRSGSDWVFESPIKARAQKSKIDDAVRALSSLRAIEWVAPDDADPALLGLAPPQVSVTVTTEKHVTVEPKKEEPDSEGAADAAEDEAPAADTKEAESAKTATNEPATDEASADKEETPQERIETASYVLRVGTMSPIGKDYQVYVQVGDEPTIATVNKTSTDKLLPDMKQWRDLRIITADATKANGVEVVTPTGTIRLQAKDGKWAFADTDKPADRSAVNQLLSSAAALRATNFVAFDRNDPARFGLDAPQAEIRLTIPGRTEAEHIVVGGYTDATAKRMVYVRSGDSDSVAKVRVSAVADLVRDLGAYRDRTIFDIAVPDVQQLTVTRPNKFTDRPFTFTLAREGDGFKLTAPVEAPTDTEAAGKLVDSVSKLDAISVVDADQDLSAYGLDDPEIVVALAYSAPPEETDPEVDAEADASGPPSPDQTTATAELFVSREAATRYAKRADTDEVYVISQNLYDLLHREYHAPQILDFQESQVVKVALQAPEGTQGFTKDGDAWTYSVEPDLPVDATKVKNYLVNLRDLRTDRYVDYNVEQLATYGLDAPEMKLTLTLDDDRTIAFHVSPSDVPSLPADARFGAIDGTGHVFLVSADTLERMKISIDEFEVQ